MYKIKKDPQYSSLIKDEEPDLQPWKTWQREQIIRLYNLMQIYGCTITRLSERFKDKTYEQIRRVLEKLRRHNNGEIPDIEQAFKILEQGYKASIWNV